MRWLFHSIDEETEALRSSVVARVYLATEWQVLDSSPHTFMLWGPDFWGVFVCVFKKSEKDLFELVHTLLSEGIYSQDPKSMDLGRY